MGCLVSGDGNGWQGRVHGRQVTYFAYDLEEPLLQQLPLPRVQQSCHCSRHPVWEIIVILIKHKAFVGQRK